MTMLEDRTVFVKKEGFDEEFRYDEFPVEYQVIILGLYIDSNCGQESVTFFSDIDPEDEIKFNCFLLLVKDFIAGEPDEDGFIELDSSGGRIGFEEGDCVIITYIPETELEEESEES